MRPLVPALAALAFVTPAPAVDYPTATGAELAHTFPYSTIGQLRFASGRLNYSGSGTVVRPNSVLTAAHNLWDADQGFSTKMQFRRGQYGATSLSKQYASRMYVLSGYRENARSYSGDSVRAFSYDLGALVFRQPVADGSFAGWWANPSLLGDGAYSIALGYGGEYHTGDDLLSVTPQAGYYPVFGGFYENDSLYFEAGMSGGPVFGRDASGKLFVGGVVVASSTDPVTGGIRILNSSAANFIRTYTK